MADSDDTCVRFEMRIRVTQWKWMEQTLSLVAKTLQSMTLLRWKLINLDISEFGSLTV